MIHFLLFLPLSYGIPDKPQTMLWLFRGHISGQLFLIPRHVSQGRESEKKNVATPVLGQLQKECQLKGYGRLE